MNLPLDITPFLTKTTAIMSAVIILSVIGAWLVSTEKEINRKTVEKYLKNLRRANSSLIKLEVFLALLEFVEFLIGVYWK
jgi:hypothetical protein